MWATGETPAVAKVTATARAWCPGLLVRLVRSRRGGRGDLGRLASSRGSSTLSGTLHRGWGHSVPGKAVCALGDGNPVPSAQGVPVDDEPLTSAIILDGLTGKPVQQVWFLLLRTVGSTYPRQNRGLARRSTKVETCS